MKIDIDPDEFKALFFTSGTTANSKGVMVNNRQLANNINAVSAYVKVNEKIYSSISMALVGQLSAAVRDSSSQSAGTISVCASAFP